MEQDGVTETFFTGTYDHTLDAKGRVSLPAKFRRSLPVELKVLPMGKSVLLFTREGYDQYVKNYFPNGMNLRDDVDKSMMFYLTATAEDTEIDSAGRISISSKLRASAHLDKEVSIVRVGDHIEMMSREVYAEKMAAASKFFG